MSRAPRVIGRAALGLIVIYALLIFIKGEWFNPFVSEGRRFFFVVFAIPSFLLSCVAEIGRPE